MPHTREVCSAAAIALLAALYSARADASPLSERAAALAPGEWALLGSYEDLRAATADTDGWRTFEYSFRMHWVGSPGTGRLVHLGSGHGSGRWQLVQYDEATDSWSRDPSAALGCHIHSYDQFAVVDGDMYAVCLDGSFQHWDGSAWTSLARWPGGYPTLMAMAYFPPTNAIWVANGWGANDELYSYDLTTGTWTDRGTLAIGANLDMVYSPIHDRVVISGGDGSSNVYVIDPSGSVRPSSTTTPLRWRVKTTLADYDPATGDILLFFADDDSIHTYDPVDDRLTSLGAFADQPPFTLESSPEERWGHGVVAATIPDYGVIMFAEDSSGDVFLYRPPTSGPGVDPRPDAGIGPDAGRSSISDGGSGDGGGEDASSGGDARGDDAGAGEHASAPDAGARHRPSLSAGCSVSAVRGAIDPGLAILGVVLGAVLATARARRRR